MSASYPRTQAFLSTLFPPPSPHAPPPHTTPADDLLPALAHAADDDEKVDQVRDALAAWVRIYLSAGRPPVPDGRTLAPAQLDHLVLKLLHQFHEDASPQGRSLSPPLPLSALLAKAAQHGSLGPTAPPRRKPQLNSAVPAAAGSGSASVSSSAFPPLPTVAAAGPWGSGPASPSVRTPRSSRPGSPILNSSGASLWGGVAVSRPGSATMHSPTPIIRPPRSLNQSPAPVVPPAGVIGLGSPRTAPASSFKSASSTGGSSSALYAEARPFSPSTPTSALPTLSAAVDTAPSNTGTGLQEASSPPPAAASGSSAVGGSTPTPSGPHSSLTPHMNAHAPPTGLQSRPASPSRPTTSSPKLNLAAAEFTPRSGRTTPSVLTSPLAAASRATLSSTRPSSPWTMAAAPRAESIASSHASSGSGVSFPPPTWTPTSVGAGGGDFSPPSAVGMGTGSEQSLLIGSGSVAAPASVVAAEEDEDDEFSPFAPARPILVPSGPSATTATLASAANVVNPNAVPAPLASTAYLVPDDPASGPPAAGSHEGTVMPPLDVLCAILMGAQGDDPNSSETYVWTRGMVEQVLSWYNFDVQATLAAVLAHHGRPPPAPPAPSENEAGPVLVPRGADVPASMNPRLYFPEGPRGFSRGGSDGVQVMTKEAFTAAKRGAWKPTSTSSPGSGQGTPAAKASTALPSSSHVGSSTNSAPIRTSTPLTNPSALPFNGASSGASATFGGSAAGGGGSVTGPAGTTARVCRYYLAGDCRRADCRFSHDLGRALCKYWLRGECLNAQCAFLHDYGPLGALASGVNRIGLSDAPGSAQAQSPVQVSARPSGKGLGQWDSTAYAPGAPETSANDNFPSLDTFSLRRPGGGQSQSSGLGTSAGSASPTSGQAQGQGAKRVPNEAPRYASAAQKKSARPSASSNAATASASRPSDGPTRTIPTRRIALRAPTLLPTLETGQSVASLYAAQRAEANALSSERAAALRSAAGAYARGDGAMAHKWSARATELNAQLGEERSRSTMGTIKERHAQLRTQLLGSGGARGGSAGALGRPSDEPGAKGLRGKPAGAELGLCLGVARRPAVGSASARNTLEERTEYLLDLHGLHAAEAQEVAEAFLLGLESEQVQGLAYLAVGVGKHSAPGQPNAGRLNTAVKQFLTAWAYPHAEVEGVLVVDPLVHS